MASEDNGPAEGGKGNMILFGAAIVVLVAAAAFWMMRSEGPVAETAAEERSGGFRFAYSTIDPGIPYFAGVVQGMRERAEELGDELVTVTNGNSNAVKQGNDIQDLIAQDPDGILVTPISATQSIGWASNAARAGVPVLATMSPVGESYDPPLQEGVIGSLQILPYETGVVDAELLAAVIPSGSEIGILTGPDGTATTPEFRRGFVDRMSELGDYTFHDTPPQPVSTAGAGLSACQALILSNPEIRGIFSMSDEMTVGCIQAPALGDIKVVGIGGTNAVLDLIREGRVYGTTCWMPRRFGAAAIDLFHGILSGEIPEGTIENLQVPGITADNLEDCPQDANAS